MIIQNSVIKVGRRCYDYLADTFEWPLSSAMEEYYSQKGQKPTVQELERQCWKAQLRIKSWYEHTQG